MTEEQQALLHPIRIQRSRAKGWRMPENTVSVTRPGRWGNPFKVWPAKDASALTAYHAVKLYREALAMAPPEVIAEIRQHLRGKNLACFCHIDEPCHADVLLEIANA